MNIDPMINWCFSGELMHSITNNYGVWPVNGLDAVHFDSKGLAHPQIFYTETHRCDLGRHCRRMAYHCKTSLCAYIGSLDVAYFG